MRKFAWKNVRFSTNDLDWVLSLIEFVNGGVLFWASIRLFKTDKEQYEFVAFDQNRKLKQSTPNSDSIEEAKEAIVLFLKENGTITENDVVENA